MHEPPAATADMAVLTGYRGGARYFFAPLETSRMSLMARFDAGFLLLAALLVLDTGELALAQKNRRSMGQEGRMPKIIRGASPLMRARKQKNPPGMERVSLFSGSGARIRT
jgi:hypothetical protein